MRKNNIPATMVIATHEERVQLRDKATAKLEQAEQNLF